MKPPKSLPELAAVERSTQLQDTGYIYRPSRQGNLKVTSPLPFLSSSTLVSNFVFSLNEDYKKINLVISTEIAVEVHRGAGRGGALRAGGAIPEAISQHQHLLTGSKTCCRATRVQSQSQTLALPFPAVNLVRWCLPVGTGSLQLGSTCREH
ncbi:hypothetical protein J6590_023899 [Homalodisca vitripennis]|nr:hypothetical protein J6590_023899 [Homalodisca vitripennis]